MTSEYMAFISDGSAPLEEAAGHRIAQLRSSGWVRRLSTPHAVVMTNSQAQTVAVGSSGLIIGRVFSKFGHPVLTAADLDPAGPWESHLLADYWGEYVTFALDGDSPGHVRVLRDPSGALECVYAQSDGFWVVTSSFSQAATMGVLRREVDWDSIKQALFYTHLRSERTCFIGLREVLPGCLIDICRERHSVHAAWQPWKFLSTPQREASIDASVFKLRNAVTIATKCLAADRDRLMLELSGGLDSSIVACCLQGHDDIISCTLTTPIHGTDERPYAKLVTDRLGLHQHCAQLSIRDAWLDAAPSCNAVAPAMGPLHHATDAAMSKFAADHDVSAIFSGAGGDSIFCYLRNASPAADALLERGVRAGYRAARNLSSLHEVSIWKAARLTFRKATRGAKSPYAAIPTHLNPLVPTPPLSAHPWFSPPKNTLPGDRERVFDLVGTQSYRAGMARGEKWPLKLPLLTQPVLEACLSVPTWMWITGGRDRSIARRAFSDQLPSAVVDRRSKGTYLNYCGAVYETHKRSMTSFLEEGVLNSKGLLDLASIREFNTRLHPTRGLEFMRIFDLCMVETWLRHQS